MGEALVGFELRPLGHVVFRVHRSAVNERKFAARHKPPWWWALQVNMANEKRLCSFDEDIQHTQELFQIHATLDHACSAALVDPMQAARYSVLLKSSDRAGRQRNTVTRTRGLAMIGINRLQLLFL